MPTRFARMNAVMGRDSSHGSLVRYSPCARKLKTRNDERVDSPPETMNRPISTKMWGRRGGTLSSLRNRASELGNWSSGRLGGGVASRLLDGRGGGRPVALERLRCDPDGEHRQRAHDGAHSEGP